MDGCSCTVFRNLCCYTRCFRCKNFCLLPTVFSSRSFEHVVLNRQKPYKTSFVGGQFFRTAFVAKTAKTFVFYLLFFAVEVLKMTCLHRKNSAQCKFRRRTVLPTAFFLCSNNRQMFCNCPPSSRCLFRTVFFCKKRVAFCL